jgi:hypothetical protein
MTILAQQAWNLMREKGAGIMNDIDTRYESFCHNEAVIADHRNEATNLGAQLIANRAPSELVCWGDNAMSGKFELRSNRVGAVGFSPRSIGSI